MSINKDMMIAEILMADPMIATILMKEGMHCISCSASGGETLAEAGRVHGMTEEDLDALVSRINDFLYMMTETD